MRAQKKETTHVARLENYRQNKDFEIKKLVASMEATIKMICLL